MFSRVSALFALQSSIALGEQIVSLFLGGVFSFAPETDIVFLLLRFDFGTEAGDSVSSATLVIRGVNSIVFLRDLFTGTVALTSLVTLVLLLLLAGGGVSFSADPLNNDFRMLLVGASGVDACSFGSSLPGEAVTGEFRNFSSNLIGPANSLSKSSCGSGVFSFSAWNSFRMRSNPSSFRSRCSTGSFVGGDVTDLDDPPGLLSLGFAAFNGGRFLPPDPTASSARGCIDF